ncbi:hypothetical protein [Umezawaea sp.]|uniref:hypothetical protein n=1 Tax=Umezawaea sp. TaxID=1955258 RepID=UPI002ED3CDFB
MGNGKTQEVLAGAVTGVLAFVAAGVVAAVGVALLGVGSVVGHAVAVVASAVGTPLTLVPNLPRAGTALEVDVRLHAVATGVAAVGVLVLVLGFRRQAGAGAMVGAAAAVAVLVGSSTAATASAALSAEPLSAEPLSAVLLAGLGVVAVWALCRAPSALRPALSATSLVLGVAAVVTTAAGAVVAQRQDARAVGAVLLGGPSALFAAITAGLGVPWSVDVDPRVTGLLGGVLPDLPSTDLPTWPFTALACVLLLVCGTVAAARAPVSGATDLVLRNAAALGLVFGAASAVMVLAASPDLDLLVSARGFVFLETTAGVGGPVWTAVALGLVAGASAGALGALLLVAVRRADGPYPGRTGSGEVFGGVADGVQGTPRAAGDPAAGGRGRPDAAGAARGEPAVRRVRGRDGGRRRGSPGAGRA